METYIEYLDFIETKIGTNFKNKIDIWRKLTPSNELLEEITDFIRPFNINDRTIIYPLSYERKYKLNEYQKINDNYIIDCTLPINNITIYKNKDNDNLYKIEKYGKICSIIIDKRINIIGNTILDRIDINLIEEVLKSRMV